MLKKKILGIGILGIGVLCMLMNSSANVVFFRDLDETLNDWTLDTGQTSGTIGKSSDQYHKGASMNIGSAKTDTSPYGQRKAYAVSGVISSYSGSQYILEMYIKPIVSTYHWFYVLYNGNIKCIMGFEDQGSMKLQLVTKAGGSIDVATLNANSWYLLRFDVTPTGQNKHVDVYVTDMDTPKVSDKALYSDTATSQILMGDDESSSNWGSMIFDNIKLQKSDGSVIYLLETFNTGGWREWSLTQDGNGYSGSISLDGTAGHYWNDNTLSLKICSPKTAINEYGQNMAWVFTPSYSYNSGQKYYVSMWVYLPGNENYNLYVPFNGHIKCIISYVNGNNRLYWEKSDGSATEVGVLSTGAWHYLFFEVRPGTKKYDITIDNVEKNKKTADFCGDTANAFLAIGDDEKNVFYGTIFIDDVRIDQ